MKIQEAIVKRIHELIKQNNYSIGKVATVSAVPPSTVKNILNGNSRNTGICTIKKVCDGLGISFIEFVDSPLFKELEQEIE